MRLLKSLQRPGMRGSLPWKDWRRWVTTGSRGALWWFPWEALLPAQLDLGAHVIALFLKTWRAFLDLVFLLVQDLGRRPRVTAPSVTSSVMGTEIREHFLSGHWLIGVCFPLLICFFSLYLIEAIVPRDHSCTVIFRFQNWNSHQAGVAYPRPPDSPQSWWSLLPK